MAGGNKNSNINEFFVQASKYEESESIMDSVYKLINLFGQTHPFPVLRFHFCILTLVLQVLR